MAQQYDSTKYGVFTEEKYAPIHEAQYEVSQQTQFQTVHATQYQYKHEAVIESPSLYPSQNQYGTVYKSQYILSPQPSYKPFESPKRGAFTEGNYAPIHKARYEISQQIPFQTIHPTQYQYGTVHESQYVLSPQPSSYKPFESPQYDEYEQYELIQHQHYYLNMVYHLNLNHKHNH